MAQPLAVRAARSWPGRPRVTRALCCAGAGDATAGAPEVDAAPKRPPLFSKKLTRKQRGSYADSLPEEARGADSQRLLLWRLCETSSTLALTRLLTPTL